MKQPGNTRQVFISYSRADEGRVTSIVSHLRALGAPLAIDVVDARPEQPMDERLQRGGYYAAMLSPSAAASPWMRRDLEHALAVEGASGRVKVIPCLLEQCDLPASVTARAGCDFTRGLFPGMASLVAGIERDAEVITCSLDPAQPLRLDAAGLRAQLEAALLLSGPRARLYFLLDDERLERALAAAWADHAQKHRGSFRASFATSAALMLRNLATCLGKAAWAVQASLVEGLASAALLEEVVSRAATLVLFDHWKLLRSALGDEPLLAQRAAAARAAFAEIERVESRPGQSEVAPPPAMHAELFQCDYEDLLEVELRARPPLLSALAFLPRRALRVDTLSIWQHGHCPPASELAADDWFRCAVPSMVKHFVWHDSMRLQRTVASHADELSFAAEDYESMGPR